MTAYQGLEGGPRDPATPGGYCLTRCYCGTCPQYAEQQRQLKVQRDQEYEARVRRESERAPRGGRSNLTSAPEIDPPITADDRFRAFHLRNPHVYARLEELVAEAVARGFRRIGVGALFEQMRYGERTETNGDRYRLNNDHRAPMVRLLIENHPEWAALFELRERQAS